MSTTSSHHENRTARNRRFTPVYRTLSRLIPAAMKKSILLRSFYLIVVLTGIALIIMGCIRYAADYSHIRHDIRKEGDVIASRISSALALPIWDFNEEQITATIMLELDTRNVAAITASYHPDQLAGYMKTRDGQTARIDNSDFQKISADYDSVSTRDIVYKGIVVGKATVYMSFRAATREITLSFLVDFFTLLIMSGVMVLILFFTIKKNVLDPVIFLQDSVINLSKKDFSTRIHISSEDEIGALAGSFNHMAATIEDYNLNLQYLVKKKTDQLIKAERLAATGGMVAGMAHEMNTPLGTALTAISHDKQLIEELEESFAAGTMKKESFLRYVRDIKNGINLTHANLQRAAVLIDKFKRVAIDDTEEPKELFNVKNIICESVYSIEPHFTDKTVGISILCSDTLVLTGYPRLLSQIITNLMLNSIMHGFAGRETGAVRVTAETDKTMFILTFYDDGQGIDAERLDKIFDPFFTTKRNQGGTGLGLTIVHNIVHHNFGGDIICQSSADGGTLFTIRFPVS
jgi:signal transduction histidine kinase